MTKDDANESEDDHTPVNSQQNVEAVTQTPPEPVEEDDAVSGVYVSMQSLIAGGRGDVGCSADQKDCF